MGSSTATSGVPIVVHHLTGVQQVSPTLLNKDKVHGSLLVQLVLRQMLQRRMAMGRYSDSSIVSSDISSIVASEAASKPTPPEH
jgi:hypothetical protein